MKTNGNPFSPKDIGSISTDRKKPREERLKDFVSQVGNPYFFKAGETVVRVNFCGEKDFSALIADILSAEI